MMKRFAAAAGAPPAGRPGAVARRLWAAGHAAGTRAMKRGPVPAAALPRHRGAAATRRTRRRSTCSRSAPPSPSRRPASSPCCTCSASARRRSASAATPIDGAPLVQTMRGVGAVSKAHHPAAAGRGTRRARPVRHRLAGRRGGRPRRAVRRRRAGPRAAAPGDAPRAGQPRRVTAASSVLYGARTPADILYRDELVLWRRMLDVQVEVTVDRGRSLPGTARSAW